MTYGLTDDLREMSDGIRKVRAMLGSLYQDIYSEPMDAVILLKRIKEIDQEALNNLFVVTETDRKAADGQPTKPTWLKE